MSVNGLLSAFALRIGVDIPLKLDSTSVNNPNQGGKGDSDWASVPTIRFVPVQRERLTTKHLQGKRR